MKRTIRTRCVSCGKVIRSRMGPHHTLPTYNLLDKHRSSIIFPREECPDRSRPSSRRKICLYQWKIEDSLQVHLLAKASIPVALRVIAQQKAVSQQLLRRLLVLLLCQLVILVLLRVLVEVQFLVLVEAVSQQLLRRLLVLLLCQLVVLVLLGVLVEVQMHILLQILPIIPLIHQLLYRVSLKHLLNHRLNHRVLLSQVQVLRRVL